MYMRSNEKKGGGLPNSRSMEEFSVSMDNCNLLDTSYVGPDYTWKRGDTYERRDRCLANVEWMNMFKDAVITYLNYFKSDHIMILVQLKKEISTRPCSSPPFRFISLWFSHEGFEVVKAAWRPFC